MCSVKGHGAIAVLVGEIAVRTCRDRSEKARCDWLRSHVVDEILACCRKRTPNKPYGEDEEEPAKQSTA